MEPTLSLVTDPTQPQQLINILGDTGQNSDSSFPGKDPLTQAAGMKQVRDLKLMQFGVVCDLANDTGVAMEVSRFILEEVGWDYDRALLTIGTMEAKAEAWEGFRKDIYLHKCIICYEQKSCRWDRVCPEVKCKSNRNVCVDCKTQVLLRNNPVCPLCRRPLLSP